MFLYKINPPTRNPLHRGGNGPWAVLRMTLWRGRLTGEAKKDNMLPWGWYRVKPPFPSSLAARQSVFDTASCGCRLDT